MNSNVLSTAGKCRADGGQSAGTFVGNLDNCSVSNSVFESVGRLRGISGSGTTLTIDANSDVTARCTEPTGRAFDGVLGTSQVASQYKSGMKDLSAKDYAPITGTEISQDYKAVIFSFGVNHRVTYDLDGGTGTVPDESAHVEGWSFSVAPNTAVRPGYIFGGWSDGTRTWFEGDVCTMGTSPIVFKAIWNEAQDVMYIETDSSGKVEMSIPKDSNVQAAVITSGSMNIVVGTEAMEKIRDSGLTFRLTARALNYEESYEITAKLGTQDFDGTLIVGLQSDLEKGIPSVYMRNDGTDTKMDYSVFRDGMVYFECNQNSVYVLKYADGSTSGDVPAGIAMAIAAIVAISAVVGIAFYTIRKN